MRALRSRGNCDHAPAVDAISRPLEVILHQAARWAEGKPAQQPVDMIHVESAHQVALIAKTFRAVGSEEKPRRLERASRQHDLVRDDRAAISSERCNLYPIQSPPGLIGDQL